MLAETLLPVAVTALMTVWAEPMPRNCAAWVRSPVMLWLTFSVWVEPSVPVAVTLLDTARADQVAVPGV